MKRKETSKNLEDFATDKVSKVQIDTIKGGQGSSIVEEDAIGI